MLPASDQDYTLALEEGNFELGTQQIFHGAKRHDLPLESK